MIITCESCRTKFRLDSTRLRRSQNKVRCSRCGNVFFVSNQGKEQTIVPVELSDDDDASTINNIISAPSVPEPPPKPLRKKQRSIILPLLLMLGIAMVVGGGLWLFKAKTSVAPPVSEIQKKIPAEETKQPSLTIVDTTQAYFLENTNGGQIFVIEGEILNESPKPVSFVLLEGKLYTKNNLIAQSQRSYAGNFMTRDELAKLSIAAIQDRMMNREGRELMNVHIAKGKRVPFMLVFHNLPEVDALNDYSVEVISAQFD